MVLAVEASCIYRGIEVVRISHGWQAGSHGRQVGLMVRWYEDGWRYCGHPCQGSN